MQALPLVEALDVDTVAGLALLGRGQVFDITHLNKGLPMRGEGIGKLEVVLVIAVPVSKAQLIGITPNEVCDQVPAVTLVAQPAIVAAQVLIPTA